MTDRPKTLLFIQDQPKFKWRGMHLDVARHYMPVSFIKKFLDTMAFYKLNVFHIHFTDDQGWRIEIEKYPRLHQIASSREETLIGKQDSSPKLYDGQVHSGYYTKQEIREIVEYAKDRYITIIPEIDMPGHTQAVLAAYPEYSCTDMTMEVRTQWGISQHIINPAPKTIEFVKDILDEIVELFPSEYIHIGGDEAHKYEWEENKEIQNQMSSLGLTSENQLQGWFINELAQHLKLKGRKLIGWNEILEGGFLKDVAVMTWIGGEKAVREALEKGEKVVLTPCEYTYFDYCQNDKYEDEPLNIGGYISLEKVYMGFDHWIPSGFENKVEGIQGQLWTEYMKTPKEVEYMAFPRLFAMAEIAWSTDSSKDWLEFKKRVRDHFKYLDQRQIYYYNKTLDHVE